MDTTLTLSALARRRGLALILTAGKARLEITNLILELILRGPLFIIAGSEWLPAYELTRKLRRRTIRIKEILNRMYSARAATCCRLSDSLAALPSNGEPVLALDFLHTFYEADIPLPTRERKLKESCGELKRLAFYRPVIVMTQMLPTEEYERFIPSIYSISDTSLTLETQKEQITQLVLL